MARVKIDQATVASLKKQIVTGKKLIEDLRGQADMDNHRERIEESLTLARKVLTQAKSERMVEPALLARLRVLKRHALNMLGERQS